MKIALAMIAKDTLSEAVLLDQCLKNVSPFVDGIYITTDSKEGHIKTIAEKYEANISEFKWVNDFSKARNFNFSQVPKDFDYILWCDADDVL